MAQGSSDSTQKNLPIGDVLHCDLDSLRDGSLTACERPARRFDESIALRSALPLSGNHVFRYALSMDWIRRGDALVQLGGHFLVQAVKSYDQAVTLLESLLPDENPLYFEKLAFAWLHRGEALQRQKDATDKWETIECFREALEVLEHPSAAGIVNKSTLLAEAWTHIAEAWIDSDQTNIEDIRSAIRKALTLVKWSEPTDAVSAEIDSKARHLLFRLAMKDVVTIFKT